MSYSTLKVSVSPRGILEVRLFRPEVRNAFNHEMIAELTRVFSTQATSDAVRVVVLRGEGQTFCSGGDLNWMKRSAALDYEENLKETVELTRMFGLINECPRPLIGAVHGAALGGGVGLVSVCDSVIASKETQFSLSEVRLGIVPACIGPFVVSKVGASHARKLFVTAERFGAERAREIGLIHDLVDQPSDLDGAIERVTDSILKCGPNAIQAAKKLVLDLGWPERRSKLADPEIHVSEVLARLRVSPEGQEGLKAFLEKRTPKF